MGLEGAKHLARQVFVLQLWEGVSDIRWGEAMTEATIGTNRSADEGMPEGCAEHGRQTARRRV